MFFRKSSDDLDTPPKKEFVFKEEGLDELIAYIKDFSGIDMEPKRDIFAKKTTLFCKNLEIESYNELRSKIASTKEVSQDFMNLITVNETYFYRELAQLKEAVSYIKTLQGHVRILCAPSSSGEEVYSLVLLANEMGLRGKDITFVGIDINSEIIDKANEGIYTQRSLHRLDEGLKDRYFTIVDDNMYKIKKDYTYDVSFKVVNIFDKGIYDLGKFDLILSRNMMIYFNRDYKLKTIEVFYKLLKPSGRLYAGHADLIPDNYYLLKDERSRFYAPRAD